MRGTLAAVVAGLLSLGLVTDSRAQAPTGLDPMGSTYGQNRDKYPVVYPQTSAYPQKTYGTGPFGLPATMYPTVYFEGHHSGCYPTWAIPYSPMASKFHGSWRFPWSWPGNWLCDYGRYDLR